MLMIKKLSLIPSVRFPQFRDQWQAKNLGAIAHTVTSGARDWAQYYSKSGSKFIRMTNLARGGIQLLLDDLRFVDIPEDSSEGKRTSLEAEDILISVTAELGKIGWIPPNFGTAYINQHVALVRLDLDRTDSRFVAHLLSSKRMNNTINRLNDSGAKSGLNLPTISSFPVRLPCLPEQQKIADFLTAVDGRIQQLSQKKALLQDYKKGVMQQLFTQALRFKDDHGNDFPDWEEKTLGDVADIYQPKTISQTEMTTEGYVVYGANGIIGRYDKYNHEQPQIAVTCRGNTCGTINFTEPLAWITGNAMVVNLDDQPAITKTFVFQSLKYADLRYLITGSGQPQITGSIKKHILMLPSLAEQTKIANFLTALDRKIESVSQQITHTQTFKRGLLQQMFV